MIGMMMSPTSDATIVPKAAPMMTPTARSTTLPRSANFLNSSNIVGLPKRLSSHSAQVWIIEAVAARDEVGTKSRRAGPPSVTAMAGLRSRSPICARQARHQHVTPAPTRAGLLLRLAAFLVVAEIGEEVHVERPLGGNVTGLLQRLEHTLEPRHIHRRLRIKHPVFFDVDEHAGGQRDVASQLLGGDLCGLLRMSADVIAAALQAAQETNDQRAVLLRPSVVDIDGGELPVGHERYN